MSTPPDAGQQWRIRTYRNPLRLTFSASPWRAAGYLFSYLLGGWVLTTIAFGTTAFAVGLAVTIVGAPLLAAAASVVHWCAAAERGMLRQVLRTPPPPQYRVPDQPGVLSRARTAWRDTGTWRELAYLTGMRVPLMIVDTVVVTIWATLLAGVTLPVWYWAPRDYTGLGYVRGHFGPGVPLGYFPHNVTGPGAIGVYVNSVPSALLTALVFAILFVLFNYVLVATARMHARVARAMLRRPADPLAAARLVLSGPGPLGPLV